MFTGIANLFAGDAAEGVLQIAIVVIASFLTVFITIKRHNTSIGMNYGIITAISCAMLCDVWWAVYLFSANGNYVGDNPHRVVICALSAAAVFILGNLAGSVIRSRRSETAKMWIVLTAGVICVAMAVKYVMRTTRGIVIIGGGMTDRRFYLGCTIAVAALCAVAVMISEKNRRPEPRERMLVALGLVAAITVVTVFAFHSVYGDDDVKYTEIISPDGHCVYTVAESEDYGESRAVAFVRRDAVFAQIITEWRYEKTGAPVSEGSYTVRWDDDALTINFNEGIVPCEVIIADE